MQHLKIYLSIIALLYCINTCPAIIEITNNLDEILIAYDPSSINDVDTPNSISSPFMPIEYEIQPGDLVAFNQLKNTVPLLRLNRENWWILRIQFNESIQRWMPYFWHTDRKNIPLLIKTTPHGQSPSGLQSFSLEEPQDIQESTKMYKYIPHMAKKVLRKTVR